jgi:hypothetical protein
MANPDHLFILGNGVKSWNVWREANPQLRPDLSGYDFTQIAPVYWYDSSSTRHATQLWNIDLKESDLQGAILSKQELFQADLSNSNLQGAILNDAIIKFSVLRGANLRDANLKGARLIKADFRGADLTGAAVFGVSPWGVDLENATQKDLIITPPYTPAITVDNIEVAQFIYTLLENKSIRGIIDTVTRRVVLILGRFTPARKSILDAIRDALRQMNYVPVLFDFDKPSTRTTIETITLLARMAKFILADISEAKSVLQELQAIVPDLPTVPVQPLIVSGEQEPGMFDHFRRFPWFLDTFIYEDQIHLLKSISNAIAIAEKISENQNSG